MKQIESEVVAACSSGRRQWCRGAQGEIRIFMSFLFASANYWVNMDEITRTAIGKKNASTPQGSIRAKLLETSTKLHLSRNDALSRCPT